MSFTLAQIRQDVCEELGIWNEFTTTATGGASGITLISTEFGDFPDDSLKDKFVKTTTGTTKETRKIEANQTPTGTIKPYRNFSAQIASGVTVELHDFDPDKITTYINNAIKDAYPFIVKPVVDTTLVGRNILPNAMFEEWTVSTAPDYWTADTSTLTEDTAYNMFGNSYMKVDAAGSAYCSGDTWVELMGKQNSSANFTCWVWASVASAGRIQIYTKEQDGTETTTSSDYHSGGSEWELLETGVVNIPDDLADIHFKCAVTGANVAYFDNAYCEGNILDYIIPSDIERVLAVYECNDHNDFNVNTLKRLNWTQLTKNAIPVLRILDVTAGNKIQIIGYNYFTDLSADTSTIALSKSQERAIIMGTAANILEAHGATISSQDDETVLKKADRYRKRFEYAKRLASKIPIAPQLQGGMV